jgi:hypothetical protein
MSSVYGNWTAIKYEKLPAHDPLVMLVNSPDRQVVWEKLPDDFRLPDDPVDNVNQPALAAALTEGLQLAAILILKNQLLLGGISSSSPWSMKVRR